MNRCFMSALCLSQTTLRDTYNMVLQSSSSPWRQPGPRTDISVGRNTTHERFANSHPPSNYVKVYMQLLTGLFGVNVLQCVNIEVVVLISSPVLTAQQGNS